MRYKVIFFAWIVWLLPACTQRGKGIYSKETIIFDHYLEAAFGQKIGDDSVAYVLVPSEACLGCIGGVFATSGNLQRNVRIITAEKALLRNRSVQVNGDWLWMDVKNDIDRLPFHGGNIGLVRCAGGEIYQWSSYDAQQMGSLLGSIAANR